MNLDKLPAWARHLVIVFGATFLGSVASAVVAASGVTSLDWPVVLGDAVNLGCTATASAALFLWLTPATRQYGVGSGDGEL